MWSKESDYIIILSIKNTHIQSTHVEKNLIIMNLG